MLLDNLFVFKRFNKKQQQLDQHDTTKNKSNSKILNYVNSQNIFEANNLLDQNDSTARFKSRFIMNDQTNEFFDNTILRRRITETYYQSLEHNKRPRLVKKCGELNIHMDNVPKHKRRLLSDFFNTILDMKWRWHLVIFVLTFIISWFIFATIWYMIAFVHGDLNVKIQSDETIQSTNLSNLNSSLIKTDKKNPSLNYLQHAIFLIDTSIKSFSKNDQKAPLVNQTLADFVRMQAQNEQKTKTTKTPCVHGIHDFTSALLYSVETQHTIGYGLRYITEECKFAIIFLMLQSCFGIFVQGLVAGVVFAKISRPSKRKRTIIFSHNAVVSERDGKLCFMFKIGNIRTSQLSDAKLKVSMIKSRQTKEGEFIPFQSYEMKVGWGDMPEENIFFPWPKTVEHIIDENSPFYSICQSYFNGNKISENVTLTKTPVFELEECSTSIRPEDYEIVVILEGNIETTGASCHIRTSYLPQEILFGYRFVPVYPKFTDFEYLFDYSKFDQIEPVNVDLLSLNRAYYNNNEIRVYDARKENKNYQITLQNTLYNSENKLNNEKKPTSIMSILNTFKAHSIGNNDGQQENTMSTMVEENDLIRQDVNLGNRNGRFTVVPVSETKTNKVKQVAFEKIKIKHNRANSLPPIHSNSNIEKL
ncbi:unnamed protein product [Brachionus calyciflorus]|uniref:Uncharacterized protein n=1 Tax=Brachionus calyciflorus TaxID=104777 RepID=A0A813X5W8_9BILA|nr:unnamed protein product [Brachionus calyciflorus]